MSWRRVGWALGFAMVVTWLGVKLPYRFGGVFLVPGLLARRLVDPMQTSEFWTIWFAVFVQLLTWALIAELARILWRSRRRWEAARAARA